MLYCQALKLNIELHTEDKLLYIFVLVYLVEYQ